MSGMSKDTSYWPRAIPHSFHWISLLDKLLYWLLTPRPSLWLVDVTVTGTGNWSQCRVSLLQLPTCPLSGCAGKWPVPMILSSFLLSTSNPYVTEQAWAARQVRSSPWRKISKCQTFPSIPFTDVTLLEARDHEHKVNPCLRLSKILIEHYSLNLFVCGRSSYATLSKT